MKINRPVFFCGENPGLTLLKPGTEEPVAVASYWVCTDSVWGPGHALVLWLAPKTSAAVHWGPGAVFTDHPALARGLVERLTQYFHEFRHASPLVLPVVMARCEHHYNGSVYRVTCQTPDQLIHLEWGEVLDRKQVIWPGFLAGQVVYDLTTQICPCRQGGVEINGERIDGQVSYTRGEDGEVSSSAFLAFAESWVGPFTPAVSAGFG